MSRKRAHEEDMSSKLLEKMEEAVGAVGSTELDVHLKGDPVQMPRRCCVPGCKSNYDSTLKKGGTPVSTFSFPKEESLRERWTKAIPRANWTPGSGSFVCSQHFNAEEIVRMEQIHRSDGSIEEMPLRCPRLIPGSVPHVFPDLPKYLSTEASTSRTNPEERREKHAKRLEEKTETFLKCDIIQDYDNLKDGLLQSKLDVCREWKWKILHNCIYLYIINIDFMDASSSVQDYLIGAVKVVNSIVITSDLKVKVFLRNNELSHHDLKWILPSNLQLNRWSQLENLLIRYKTSEYSEDFSSSNFKFYLKKAHENIVKAIEHIDESYCGPLEKQLDIIRDQLKLFLTNKRQYSISTKIFAFLIYFQSASCYELIRKFLFLPHKRYLQYISSSLCVSPDGDNNTYHYLSHLFKTLNDREKIVNLVIDEIYVNRKIEYKSKSIAGYSKNNPTEPAKTVQSFMISSPFGHFKEIVKLFPCNNMTGQQLKQLTLEVIQFVQSIGFNILSIITDNNRVNQFMFRTLFSDNFYMENPNQSGNLLFGMYDTVHIFKNIRNNWINLKSPGKTFMFSNFETGEIKIGAFGDIEKIFKEEEHLVIKKAYKLNSKTMYPTNFERQSVILVDNLFHYSTIAALKSQDDTKSTAEFMEIIKKWWNIVNVQNTLKAILKRDDQCSAIKSINDPNILFLKKFTLWLQNWNALPGGSFLSADTFAAIFQTTKVLIDIVETSFKKYPIKYILLGKFQSDCIEKRFGQYRQLSGCNYHVSCTQIMESEKKIRVKHLMKLEDLKDIKNVIPSEDNENTCNIDELKYILSTDYLQKCDIDEASQTYVCGYAVHSAVKRLGCDLCSVLIRDNKGENINMEYFDYLQRGGLSVPAESVKYLCFHLYAIFEYIINDNVMKGLLFQNSDVRSTLCTLTFCSLESDMFYIDLDGSCELGHPTKHAYYLVCKVIVNILLNNYTKNINSTLNCTKNNKRKLGVYSSAQ